MSEKEIKKKDKDDKLSYLIKNLKINDELEQKEDYYLKEIDEVKEKLIKIGNPALSHLDSVLKENNNPSSHYAAEILAKIDVEKAIKILVKYIEERGLDEKVKEELVKIGPECLDEVINKINYRINNPIEQEGLFCLTNMALRVLGEIRCEKSTNYLNNLLDDYMDAMPRKVFNPNQYDWPYRNIDFFHLLDCMVIQQNKSSIPYIKKARDDFPPRNVEFIICQIAIGRIKKGKVEGYLPMESMDIMLPPAKIFDALRGEDSTEKIEEAFIENYGEYFEDMDLDEIL